MRTSTVLCAATQSLLWTRGNCAAIPPVSSSLQNILKNTHDSPAYRYPTDLTRGIQPLPFHSHNDYWRDVPFYSALARGASSVEADVWLYNDTLFVGHERSALTPSRTFSSLYVEPILDTLRRQNPVTDFVRAGGPTRNGVFDEDAGRTLYLFVDVKTGGEETWPYVVEALRPLAEMDYLVTADGVGVDAGVMPGPVTVIGTGNVPLGWFWGNPGSKEEPRRVFFDAHLNALGEEEKNVTAALAPVASADFKAEFGAVNGTRLDDRQLDKLRQQIAAAKGRGIGARYWDQPEWPIGTRNAIWRLLLDEGVALLNVDDLDAVGKFWNLE